MSSSSRVHEHFSAEGHVGILQTCSHFAMALTRQVLPFTGLYWFVSKWNIPAQGIFYSVLISLVASNRNTVGCWRVIVANELATLRTHSLIARFSWTRRRRRYVRPTTTWTSCHVGDDLLLRHCCTIRELRYYVNDQIACEWLWRRRRCCLGAASCEAAVITTIHGRLIFIVSPYASVHETSIWTSLLVAAVFRTDRPVVNNENHTCITSKRTNVHLPVGCVPVTGPIIHMHFYLQSSDG